MVIMDDLKSISFSWNMVNYESILYATWGDWITKNTEFKNVFPLFKSQEGLHAVMVTACTLSWVQQTFVDRMSKWMGLGTSQNGRLPGSTWHITQAGGQSAWATLPPKSPQTGPCVQQNLVSHCPGGQGRWGVLRGLSLWLADGYLPAASPHSCLFARPAQLSRPLLRGHQSQGIRLMEIKHLCEGLSPSRVTSWSTGARTQHKHLGAQFSHNRQMWANRTSLP